MPAAFAKCRCLSPYHVPVSSPRRIARSMRISRTTRSCTLLVKGYVTYPAGACAFYLFIRQPMGRKSALRREIPWILRGFQGRLSC